MTARRVVLAGLAALERSGQPASRAERETLAALLAIAERSSRPSAASSGHRLDTVAPAADDAQRAMTETAAAERLGISPRQLRRLRQQGRGPAFIRLGRAIVYRPAALERWLAEKENLDDDME